MPLVMAKRVADNVDRHRTDLFLQQAHKASGNTAERAKFEEMGYHVTSLTEPWPHLADKHIPHAWGLARDRVLWRAQKLLDILNLLEVIMKNSNAEYVLIVEDDAFASKHFGHRLLRVLERTKYDFSYATLYSRFFHFNPNQRIDDLMPQEGWYLECGTVATLYKRESLPGFIDFVRRDIFKDPLDWAVFTYFDSHGKHPAIFVPSLFQHVGDVSTFRENNRQRAKARTFVENIDTLTVIPPHDSHGYVGCVHYTLSGYLVSVVDAQSNSFGCIVECRGYRFALHSSSSCACTNELIDNSQLIGNENCPISDGAPRGLSQSNTVAIYMTGLNIVTRDDGYMYFDIDATVKQRNEIQNAFRASTSSAIHLINSAPSLENWVQTWHRMTRGDCNVCG
jgi:hypothetical protein